MDNTRVLPHRRQSDKKRNCGAACISMLFEHYRIFNKKMSKITECVNTINSNGEEYGSNSLILKYILDQKLFGAVISAKDPKEFISFCLANDIGLIASYHPDFDSWAGHFVVVSDMADGFVYFNDPQKDAPFGINCKMSINELHARMQPLYGNDDEIKCPNVFIVLSPIRPELKIENTGANDRPLPSLEFFKDKINAFVNPYTDTWINISELTTTAAPRP